VRILLDSHIFLWWESDAARLSPAAYAACVSPDNTLLLSIASLWEIQIKLQIGKLTLAEPLEEKIRRQRAVNGLGLLTITEAHVYAVGTLAHRHRDPFDRMLVAQAMTEAIPIVTQDPLIRQYGLSIIS
jgi:PIN domain nuclease of toxin-antitoxin system